MWKRSPKRMFGISFRFLSPLEGAFRAIECRLGQMNVFWQYCLTLSANNCVFFLNEQQKVSNLKTFFSNKFASLLATWVLAKKSEMKDKSSMKLCLFFGFPSYQITVASSMIRRGDDSLMIAQRPRSYLVFSIGKKYKSQPLAGPDFLSIRRTLVL